MAEAELILKAISKGSLNESWKGKNVMDLQQWKHIEAFPLQFNAKVVKTLDIKHYKHEVMIDTDTILNDAENVKTEMQLIGMGLGSTNGDIALCNVCIINFWN